MKDWHRKQGLVFGWSSGGLVVSLDRSCGGSKVFLGGPEFVLVWFWGGCGVVLRLSCESSGVLLKWSWDGPRVVLDLYWYISVWDSVTSGWTCVVSNWS